MITLLTPKNCNNEFSLLSPKLSSPKEDHGLNFMVNKIRQNKFTPITHFKFTDCGTPEDILQVLSLKMIPESPIIGELVTITIAGQLTEDVEEGSVVKIKVSRDTEKLYDGELDLCTEFLDVRCPLVKGPIEIKHSFVVPTDVPAGRYFINAHLLTNDSRPIACLDVETILREKHFF
ncbi:565_t:CDS:1, partial [Ambispora gerdemannii]